MNDSIGIYLNDIGKVPLLTAEDERVLSRAIEKGREAATKSAAGDKTVTVKREIREAAKAKDRFIRANLRLVVSIARRYPLPQGMDLLDLIQEGNLGLEHAVDKFDWRRGF
ncbi:MAG: RNA polymerase subunit sigma, partial [Actinobacteria bacterium]|nr:RNA polymerase subunit sigma [Actinomycetota bacterium]